ncbi:MAG: cell division protein FtsK [Alphaproteobacteria bacterium]|nr:cell division protein FtsK [Alphaproteobacteria bacterium]
MTDDAYTAEGSSIPSEPWSASGRLALKRASLTVGAALTGAYGLGAVLTYSPEDPSLNTATNAAAGNIFGGPGAAFADIAVQSLGAAAPLAMAALCAAGGLRIWRKRLLARIDRTRLLAGSAGVALLAGAVAAIPSPDGWPLAAGLGGVLGDGVHNLLSGMLSLPGLPAPALIAGALAGAAGALGVGWAFQLRSQDLRTAADAASKAAANASGAATRALTYMADRVRGDEPDPMEAYRRPTLEHRSPLDEPIYAPPEPPRPAPQARPQAQPQAEPAARKPQRPQERPAPRPQPQNIFQHAGDFSLPGEDLLAPPRARSSQPDGAVLHAMSVKLSAVLQDFGVQGEITSARPGPVVTLFELEPAPGVKSSRVIGLADDIARSMSATAARVAVIPGRNAIGIELPNPKRETVYLRTLLSSPSFIGSQGALPLALGETIEGEPFAADLSKMPHLLIAGTTGSGKSVGINAMILSLLYRHTPEECCFIMIDPKMLELSVYEGIPHLLSPVVTDPKKAVVALKWTVREMEERYRKMSKLGVRNITGYNERVHEAMRSGEPLERTVHTGFDPETGEPVYDTKQLPLEPMPYIVVVIDEMADLMIVAGKEIEAAVQRLAQMARAAGIHLIMATQRPSVDVITGTIKANFPTRISYQVTSKIDSRTILGEQGAEQLLGMGDLLFMAGGGRVRRLHGPFVTDAEVERVVDMLKAQGSPKYRSDVTEDESEIEDEAPMLFESHTGDDLYDRAVEIVVRDRKASTSYLQRRLNIGYNRAATLVERLEKEGVISTANAAGKRDILVGSVE